MHRLSAWPSRFAAAVEAARNRPFAWGQHDCCLWSSTAVDASTGIDPAWPYRGSYRNEREALRLLRELGGLEGLADTYAVRIDVIRATAADVGLVVWPDGAECLGVFSGEVWMCAGDKGLVFFPRGAARIAWGIGR